MVRDILINPGMPSLVGAMLQSQKSQTAVFLCFFYDYWLYVCIIFTWYGFHLYGSKFWDNNAESH